MNPLQELIVARIREKGSLTIAEYMQWALLHPEYGYYTTRDPFGAQGDFITAPEISQIFGEMIGIWCMAVYQSMLEAGMDVSTISLVELGPGRGALMQDILRATSKMPDFQDALCITLVEASPKLRRLQRMRLERMHPRIGWAESVEELPAMPTIFIGNEFLDAMPIRQYVRTHEGVMEKMVDADVHTGELCFVVQELGLRLVKGGDYSEDEIVTESCPVAREIVEAISAHTLRYGGAGLLVDYGYTGGSNGNTLQAVKSHGFHPVLQSPGEADITAHVDFDLWQGLFQQEGLDCPDTITQGEFLRRMGAPLRLEVLLRHVVNEEQATALVSGYNRISEAAQMGELFKVLAFAHPDITIPVWFESDEEEE